MNETMRTSPLAFAVLATLLGTGPICAQDDPCLRRVLPVEVVNSDGVPVTGLKTENFTASIHGSPMKIVSVVPETKVRRVLFVLDASASVAGTPFWTTYITMAGALIASLPPGTQIGLVVFGTHANQVVPLTEEREKVQSELKRLVDQSKASYKGRSKTALWDSIRDASEYLDAPMGGDVIYVFTDGFDNASKTRAGDIEKLLLPRGIRLFSFEIWQSSMGLAPDELAARHSLREVAKVTGGSYLAFSEDEINMKSPLLDKPGKATKLGKFLAAQHRLLPVGYDIEIEAPGGLQQSSSWELHVTGENKQDLLVVYPHRLASCRELIQSRMQSNNTH
jgi:hypothetical protein